MTDPKHESPHAVVGNFEDVIDTISKIILEDIDGSFDAHLPELSKFTGLELFWFGMAFGAEASRVVTMNQLKGLAQLSDELQAALPDRYLTSLQLVERLTAALRDHAEKRHALAGLVNRAVAQAKKGGLG